VLTTLTTAPAQVPAESGWGARSLSFAMHTGLIALAVWWTQAPPLARSDPHGGTGIVFWPAPRRPASPPPDRPAGGGPPVPLPTVPIAAPVLPPFESPPAPAMPPGAVDPFPGVPGTGAVVVTGPPSPAPAAPMDARTVEEQPVLLSHPAPAYPDILRSAGIEGRVVVEAVLDTTGRVERASVRIVSSSHALFVPAASALVLGSLYRPARFGGMPVRVRIQVPVDFRLRR